MYAGQPEENLFFILLMAAILLALFWNDKIPGGSSGSSTTSTTSTGSRGDDTGTEGSGRDRGPGKDSGGGEGGDTTSRTGRDPFVRVKEQVDSRKLAFKLSAEAEARSNADIVATGFVKMSHYPTGRKLIDVDSPEKSDYLNKGNTYELEKKGMAPGAIQYTAWTKDSEGRTGTYSDNFEIKPVHEGEGDGGGPGPDGGSGPDIDIEYGDGDDGSDSTDGSSDPTGDPDGGSGGAQIQILGISPRDSELGIDVKDIDVTIFAQAEPGSTLEMLVIEFEWPTGSKYKNEIDVSGDALRKNESLNFWLENSMSLPVEGNYGLRVSVADNSKNKDSDYGTIVINKKSTNSPMASIEDLHDQQDREIELFHQGVKELETLHEDTEEQIELETNLLDEAKDILQKLNDLENVEEAIRNHLITELDGTRNMGPRQLKSMSESELEEMASEAELTTALNEAIASTSFHNSSGSINTARDLSSYVSDLMMEFEDFQDTLNRERQHQARDNSLTQKIESQVEEGLDLEKKNAKLIRSFLDNAASSTSAR